MKRRTKLLVTFSAVIGLFALFQVVPAIEAAINATRCPVPDRIVYASMREYVPPFLFNQAETICSDGSGVVYQRLPSQLKDAATLAFSPDGSHVAFESKGNLFIMSVGGSTPVPLTDGYDMAWSPDGSKLAFTRVVTVSKSGYDVQGIFVVNTECVDNQTDCKSSTTLLGRGRSPRWSPEGARIVFSDIDDDSFLKGNIYVMNSDGSGRTRLTNVEGENDAFDPAWSPDGQTIAFALSSDTCPCPRPVQIYLMTMGSSDPIYLTDGTNPIWSPDGRHIAFISDRNSEGKSFSLFDTIFRVNSLYLIARDGKETIRLTHGSNDSIYAFSWVTQ